MPIFTVRVQILTLLCREFRRDAGWSWWKM